MQDSDDIGFHSVTVDDIAWTCGHRKPNFVYQLFSILIFQPLLLECVIVALKENLLLLEKKQSKMTSLWMIE